MLSIEKLEEHSSDLNDHPMKWLFESKEDRVTTEEHKDQIFALTQDAANYLWEYEKKMDIGKFYPEVNKYFQEVKIYTNEDQNEKALKKWLYNLGIPFKTKVFIPIQPEFGFVLTWKMVIKYCSKIFFGYDLIIWDKTLNWGLYYHHDEIFHYGTNRIYNSKIRGEEILRDKILIEEWRLKSKLDNDE